MGFFFLKNEYFLGHEGFVDIFWVITKLNYIYGSFLCILGSFLKVKVQNGGFFWAAKNSFLYFFSGGGGVLEISEIYFG